MTCLVVPRVLRFWTFLLVAFAQACAPLRAQPKDDDRPIVDDSKQAAERAALVAVPTIYLAGDSTVKGGGAPQRGWGEELAAFFNPAKANVVNRAIGGRSSRTFFTESRWAKLAADVKPGDFVLIQFGHNDGGRVGEAQFKRRPSLPGTGDETKDDPKPDGTPELVHTYGWYLRQMVREARARGATVIVCGPVPHQDWVGTQLKPDFESHRRWARDVAAAEGAHFIDLTAIVTRGYEALGPEKVRGFFADARTHTTVTGAQFNARAVIAALRALPGAPVEALLSAGGAAVSAADARHVAASADPSPMLPPLPAIPAPRPVDSVPLADFATAPEVQLDFPIASGPYAPTWASIEQHYPGTPAWLREAKFGIWVHFGPQAAGESGDWYARHVYKPEHHARKHHLARHGHPTTAGYKEVLRDWNPTQLDPAALAALYRDAGARFLFVQGVHHDNFDLWASRHHPWNSTRLGPKRDLLGEWAKAARETGLRFGVTFHHEYTWWWWQTAFMADREGAQAGVPYDGHLTLADGQGQWWEGLDPRLLYGIDLREYQGVAQAALSPWSPPPAGIFAGHADYARWYATQWALRMTDVIDHYDPDFIYTDGTGQQPFEGSHTGTGLKADAMQRVIAHFYNRTLARRGAVDTFSIVKFRAPTNGTVTTEEFGIPREIKSDQAWIAEAPVGDWFYAPDFTYDSGMVIRYVVEAAARDGNAAVCISLRPDGSLDAACRTMLAEVGEWMRRNGDAIYGSRAWTRPGEGEVIDGKLKMLPGGKLGRRHAEFPFGPQDFRFTVGREGALYATCLTVPAPGTELRLTSLGTAGLHAAPVQGVELLGHTGAPLAWRQTPEALIVTCPAEMSYRSAIVLRIR